MKSSIIKILVMAPMLVVVSVLTGPADSSGFHADVAMMGGGMGGGMVGLGNPMGGSGYGSGHEPGRNPNPEHFQEDHFRIDPLFRHDEPANQNNRFPREPRGPSEMNPSGRGEADPFANPQGRK